jgi:hypothetical protein
MTQITFCVGAVITPLLANIALHVLDEAWQRDAERLGVLVRYADLSRCPHKSAYAEFLVMPSWSSDRLWLLGFGVESSA